MQFNILFFISFLITTSFTCSQSFVITKILAVDLFELENGQKIKFYGLFIPSQSDSDTMLAKVSDELYEWEKSHMLNKTFKFEFIGKPINEIYSVNIKNSFFLGDHNMANDL